MQFAIAAIKCSYSLNSVKAVEISVMAVFGEIMEREKMEGKRRVRRETYRDWSLRTMLAWNEMKEDMK